MIPLFFIFMLGLFPISPEKFFDLDKDGRLNRHERSLLKTHRRFGWELADSKSKKKFDLNQDYMLEPEEWEQYQKGRKKPQKSL